MKYIILILLLLSCTKQEELQKTSKVDSVLTITDTLAQSKKKVKKIAVPNLAGALSYTEYKTYFEKDLKLLPINEVDSIKTILEIPDNEFLKGSLKDTSKSSMARFYQFDFSSDGIEDIIYKSHYASEEWHIVLWEKKVDGYHFVQMLWGDIGKLFQEKKIGPYSFLLIRGFCCASWVGDYTVFSPNRTDGIFDYKITENYKVFMDLGNPDNIHNPIKFITVNPNYRLRSSPVINDEIDSVSTRFMGQDVYGNIIAEFETGSKGYAISSHDDSDRVWWFVVMDTSATTSKSLFYRDRNSHKIGWMSSKYLKTIEDGL